MENTDKIAKLIENHIQKHFPNISEDEYKNKFDDFFASKQDEMSNGLYQLMIKEKKNIIKSLIDTREGFVERHKKLWNEPLSMFEYFIQIIIADVQAYYKDNEDTAISMQDYQYIALSRLHGQACQLSNEILCLLNGGYAEGANARWRTLYELSVTATIIANESIEISQMFLEYFHVQNYEDYKHYYETITEPNDLEKRMLINLKNKYDYFKNKYGVDFCTKYGWLYTVIPQKKDRTFYNLQQRAELLHMNNSYSLANINVHVGPDSLFTKLSILHNNDNGLILAGASNYGLADPGKQAIHSLLYVTMIFLFNKPNFDRIIFCNALTKYAEDISTAFDSIQQKIIDTEMSKKKSP